MNSDESGQTGTDEGGGISGRWPNGDVMTGGWRPLAVVFVLLTVSGLALVGVGVAGQLPTPAERPAVPAAVDNHSDPVGIPEGDLGAGEQLSGLVTTENRAVRGSVDRRAFQARLDATESPSERADLAGELLSELDGQLANLEATVDTLAANGTTGGATARAAAVGAEAATVGALLADIEAVLLDLPATERAQRNLTARLQAHEDRAARLRERTRDARDLVDGAGTETWASPVSVADVEEAADRTMGSASQAERFFGSERIDLHVRRANGSTLRLAVDTDGGEVTAIERGPHDDPTVRVYTDYGVVRTLQRTDDPGGALQAALGEDRIVYDGVGLFDSIRYGTAGILEWLGT
jgi:hypothetical protein